MVAVCLSSAYKYAMWRNPKTPKENTVAFCFMPAKDLYQNLESLPSLYADKIFKLQHNEIWNNEKISGISGARGKHFCLWCHLHYEDIQIPLGIGGKARW